MSESRPTPQGIFSWPEICDLLPDQKLIFGYLWFNRFTNSVGCYRLPIPMVAEELSIKASSIIDCIGELSNRLLVDYDKNTGEIFIRQWFNFHAFHKQLALNCRERDIKRIKSERLKQLVIAASSETPVLEKWRPVPCNLLSRIDVMNLLPDQKLILLYLWLCIFTNSCGVYWIPIHMAAAELSLKETALLNALHEFVARGLIQYDEESSEVLVERWFSFHRFNSDSSKNICRDDAEKIQSKRLKSMTMQKINKLLSNSNQQQQKIKEYKKSAQKMATRRDKRVDLAFDEIEGIKDQIQNLLTPVKDGQNQNQNR